MVLLISLLCENKNWFLWFFTSRKYNDTGLDDVKILITSVLNKHQNHYHCNIFLENCLYQWTKKYMKEKNI